MTTGTNTIADLVIPLPVTNAGSGSASQTAYGLLAAGTTSTGALQNAGTGATGQVYISGGSSALGAWTGQNAVGGFQLITTNTITSSTATVTYTNLSTSYFAYKVVIAALVPVNNAINLLMQSSSNNGVTYLNSAGDYFWACFAISSGATLSKLNGSTTASSIQIGGSFSNTAYANNIEITLVNIAANITQNNLFYLGKYNDSTNADTVIGGYGRIHANQVNNAIQFSLSSGNIASAVFKLYAILV